MKLKKWYGNQKLEYWKDIEGYEGLYMVSSLGRVRSLERKVRNSQGKGFRTIKERILKLRIDSNGYLLVTLCKNGKKKDFYIHRLVAIAFISNVDNKPEVNHIDENKTNNNVKNLEWMTSKENINWGTRNKKHAKAMKGKYTGEKNPRARKVRCIETGEIFNTLKEASEWCGSHRSSIAKQIRGELKSTGKHPVTGEKLHWEYVEEIELDLNILIDSNINIKI